MSPEAFCPEHGPYDASLGACPYPHAGAVPRPGAPLPLEDDLPTDLGFGGGPAAGTPMGGDEGETQLPAAARRYGRAADYEVEDETALPRAAQNEDVTEIVGATSPVIGIFWVKEGPRRGKIYPIKHGTKIGRRDGDVILEDPKVSSMHSKITNEGDDFVIWDLGSSNGTVVNGKKIRQATVLYENDQVQIGDSLFVVKMLEAKSRRGGSRGKASGAKRAAKSAH